MHVTVEYTAQLKQAVGRGAEAFEIESGCTVQQLTDQLADRYGEPARSMLLNGDGRLSGAVLVFVGGTRVGDHASRELHEGDVVTFLSPISGG